MLPILLTSSNISTSATSATSDAMEWSVALDIVASCKANPDQKHRSAVSSLCNPILSPDTHIWLHLRHLLDLNGH